MVLGRSTVFLIFPILITLVKCYEVPPALVEPLTPVGLRVSIPDHEGITLFAFHGNVNEDFELGREAGQMAQDVLRKKNGRWTYINRNTKLKKGDVIYYWLYVIKDGLGKERLFQSHTVTEFFSEDNRVPVSEPPVSVSIPTEPVTPAVVKPVCKKSITLVNDEQKCSGELIFESQFTNELNKKLTPVVQISDKNEEFVVYDTHSENSFLEGGNLNIKPTLLDARYGDNFVATGSLDLTRQCTSSDQQLCKKQAVGNQFLPPILSARYTTKDSFSFRYGIVEVKAKLPRGDWVVPELWLLPKVMKYGQTHSGKIILASAFGNEQLTSSHKEIGNSHLFSGLEVGEKKFNFSTDKSDGFWSNDFHTFKMIWSSDFIGFYVDNREIGHWSGNNDSPFLTDSPNDKIAPFNEEFYLVLGLQVGGFVFPDGSTSKGHKKPWKSTNADLIRRFYFDKSNWFPTWDTKTQLKIQYVKVWAL